MNAYSEELVLLRSRVRYQPRHVSKAADLVEQRAVAATSALNGEYTVSIQSRIGELRDALTNSYECIVLLVGSELDTVTPGERGLGRLSTALPRLGGRFRNELGEYEVATLGPIMERLCLAGFSAATVYDSLIGPPEGLRTRNMERLIALWIFHMAYALNNASDSFLAIAGAASDEVVEEWIGAAKSLGLVRGVRRERRVATLRGTAAFLVGAGADLYGFLSERADAAFQS